VPVVSLLIPVCGDGEGLEDSLESAKEQFLEDLEVICINDGGSVSVSKTIKKYVSDDKRFISKKSDNIGYGGALNMGLGVAKGKYVAFLDPGDVLDKNALERISSLAAACNADVAKADFWMYPTEGKYAGKRKEAENIPFGLTGKLINIEDNPDIMYQHPSLWTAVYKRGMLVRNGVRFDDGADVPFADVPFAFKVWVCARRAVFTKIPIVEHHGNSDITPNTLEEAQILADRYAGMEAFLAQREEKLEAFGGVYQRMRYRAYLQAYKRLEGDDRLAFLTQMHDEIAADYKAGKVDKGAFEADEYSDLEMLVKSPKEFDELQQKYSGDSRGDNIKRYAKSGGASLLGKMFTKKLKKDKNSSADSPYSR